jgi:hypothetical protein
MSEIKVNKISPRSGTTVTLGDSGDTFTIPSGATINNQGTATNFGATGSASWNTTVKTGDFTAVAGEGYFVDTTSQAIDVTLPAGTAGAVIAIKDYAGTFDTNAVTLIRNGSDKIGGQAVNATLDVEGIAVTLVFVDSTQGWLVTDSGLQTEAPTTEYVTATGGNTTLTVCSHKVHIFTGPGNFCVSKAGNAAGSNTVEYLVVAGGGGSGGYGTCGGKVQAAGAGGGGGWRSFTALPGANPLNGPAALPVSVQPYTVTVGGGGSGDPANSTGGSRGSNSIFSTITSTGGGGGGSKNAPTPGSATGAEKTGGSGGGGAGRSVPGTVDEGGTGNTPPVSPSQGQPGGRGAKRAAAPASESGSGGGGGATVAGTDCPTCGDDGQPGGTGAFVVDGFFGPTAPSYGQSPTPLAPNGRYFSGGGGGGSGNTPGGQGQPGAGGGGIGGNASTPNAAGATNTGGGGGGPSSQSSTSGGPGIVVIRYKFQA